jgi:hypothetical protein
VLSYTGTRLALRREVACSEYADYVGFELTAIGVFENAGGTKAAEGLQRLASRSSDRDVREYAAKTLARVEGAQA